MKIQNLAYFSLAAAVAARDDSFADASVNPVFRKWKNQLHYICRNIDAELMSDNRGRMCPQDDCTECIMKAWNTYDINCDLVDVDLSWKDRKNHAKRCFDFNWDTLPIEDPTKPPTRPPTEPPTKPPTRPPTEPPTKPPTRPDPTIGPVDPTRDPVEPTRDPVDPTKDPVDPTRDPVDPTRDPVDPTRDPVDPTKDPVDPTRDPVDPTRDPVDPTRDPVDPTRDPVDPTRDPVDPTKDPVDPTRDPVDPTRDPVDPTRDPVDPTRDPVDPTKDPVDPTRDPVDPTRDPVDPTRDPVDPTREPTRPPPIEWPTGHDIRWCYDYCKWRYYTPNGPSNVQLYQQCLKICKERMRKDCHKIYECEREYPDRDGAGPEKDTCRVDCYDAAPVSAEKKLAVKGDTHDIFIAGFDTDVSLSGAVEKRKPFNKKDELYNYCKRKCKDAPDQGACMADCKTFLNECACLADSNIVVEVKSCMFKCKHKDDNKPLQEIKDHYDAIIDVKDEIRALCKQYKKCGAVLANGDFNEKTPWAIWRKIKDMVHEKCSRYPNPDKCKDKIAHILNKMIGDITKEDLDKIKVFIQRMDVTLPVD